MLKFRPFDLEKAILKEPFEYKGSGSRCILVAYLSETEFPEVSAKHRVVCHKRGDAWTQSFSEAYLKENYFMTPLFTLEGKPVYKGDELFDCTLGKNIVVQSINTGLIWHGSEGETSTIRNLSWPKTTFILGGIEVPLPETRIPAKGRKYWTPYLNGEGSGITAYYSWDGHALDHALLSRNMIHLSFENAYAHAKAILAASGVK